MIARYKEHEYLYAVNRRRKEIITTKSQKADMGFVHEGQLYFKEIRDEDLSDIFDVEFWITYRSDIPYAPEQWKLSNEKSVVTNDGVLLVFTEGVLPGWNVIGKNVCSSRVNISEISGVRMCFLYKKKNGSTCDCLIEERSIAVSELKDYFDRYNKLAL